MARDYHPEAQQHRLLAPVTSASTLLRVGSAARVARSLCLGSQYRASRFASRLYFNDAATAVSWRPLLVSPVGS